MFFFEIDIDDRPRPSSHLSLLSLQEHRVSFSSSPKPTHLEQFRKPQRNLKKSFAVVVEELLLEAQGPVFFSELVEELALLGVLRVEESP